MLCLFTCLSSLAHADTPSSRYYDYLHGLLADRGGHSAEALSYYQKVVAEDPQAGAVYRDLAELQLRLGHTNDAVASAERVQALSPKDADSLMFLASVYAAQGNLAKAAATNEKVLAIDPNHLQALENLGNYYSILDPEKGRSYYQRYLAIDPKNSEIYFQIAMSYQKQGNIDKAVDLLKKSADLGPNELAPRLALAAVYEARGSTTAAIEQYEYAVEIEPSNASLYMRLGRLYYGQKKWDESESAFQNARSLAPDDATVYYWLARVAEERENWKEAAAHAEAAYQHSKDPQFLPLLAYYLTLDHRPAEAIPWLEKARTLMPKNANALLFLGMDYLDTKQPQKARDVLAEGVAIAPKDTQLLYQLGNAEDQLGHTEEAIRQFQKVLEIDPKNAGAMNYIGYSWADKGMNLDEAERLLRRAVALDPTNGAYLDSLGWTLYKKGDKAGAIALLEKASAILPDPEIFGHLGDVYWADGRVVPAWQAWTKALAGDPDNKALKKKIEEAAARVIPGSHARKLLKFVEGNNRQIMTLTGRVLAQSKWRGHSFKTVARLGYQRPDGLTLDVAPGTSTVRIILSSGVARVEPAEFAGLVGDFPTTSLNAIPDFFSGRLLSPLDSSSVKTEQGRHEIIYSDATREARIDLDRGVLTDFKEESAETGRFEVRITSYTFAEGLWLPMEMQLRNKKQSLKSTLRFSDWQINPE